MWMHPCLIPNLPLAQTGISSSNWLSSANRQGTTQSSSEKWYRQAHEAKEERRLVRLVLHLPSNELLTLPLRIILAL
jgi:hypothetical protein